LKKYIVFFLPILLLAPNAWAEIYVQNDQKYIGDDGALHIVGEIQNDFDAPVNQISIHATLYSENGDEIKTSTTTSLVNKIMPGMKGPFDFIIVGKEVKMMNYYALDIDYKITEPKSQVIDITSSEFERDNLDNLMIKGTVVNRGEATANTVVVIATLYDKEGKVVAVSKTHAEPDYLKANDEVFFLISVPDKMQSTIAVDYSLTAESEEYAAVPEFPFGSLILLASSVSVYIVLTRYSSKVLSNVISATNTK